MEQRVLETIAKYKLINPKDKILVAVSGGPDSISLLNILNKNKEILQIDLYVAHINHQIRKEADDDEAYVKKYCEKNNIVFFSKRIEVIKYANNNKIGLEEAGRKVRYEFLEQIYETKGINKIAIAHNKNDKAETVIMNIIRGSGISGLKGIEPIRGKYIRPLIECQRDEIEEYCKIHNLQPRIDKTNFINDCTRNKIRNEVIPYIRENFNSNIIETIIRLSETAIETEAFVNEEVEKQFKVIMLQKEEKRIILDLKKFNNLDMLLKKKILLYTIEQTLGNVQNIEKVNIEDIIKLCQNNIGNKYLKPNKNIKILVNKGKIFFEVEN